MTVLSRCRVSHCAFAAALGTALLAAPAAHAFTIEDHSTNPGAASKLSDQDPRASRFGSANDGQTTIRQGNTTLQFGGQRSSGDRYFNPDRMFEPNGRPLTDR